MEQERLVQLESDLRTGAMDQCKRALDELAQGPSDLVVPMLLRVAEEGDFLRRRFAIMGLGNHRTEAAFAALQARMAAEQDGNVLAEIANSLMEFGDRAVPLLAELFQRSTHWLTRQSIISILIDAQADEVLLAVIREALADPEQSVKETAILGLAQIWRGALKDEALDLLAELAQDGDWRVRWRAANALAPCPDPRAKAILAPLRQDAHHRVVAAALEAGF